MSYWGEWPPYVPVEERRRKAAKTTARMIKKGEKPLPVNLRGRQISTTFWGQAWCRHLEAFSDFSNRLPRGRTYVRNGSVIHLNIHTARIEAMVQGSSLYKVTVKVEELDRKKWSAIRASCAGQIGSLIELLQGRISSSVMQSMSDQDRGLFPKPKEMTFSCSCPDWARMCKHVAAVLYGVGHRLDHDPALLFKLRNVDHLDLIDGARVTTRPPKNKARIIRGQDLSKIFGIDLDDRLESTPSRDGKTDGGSRKAGKKSRPTAKSRKPGKK
jgi:uncharacterized Zn finger protein